MKKLILIFLLFIAFKSYGQVHITVTVSDTVTLTSIINTALSISLSDMSQAFTRYELAIYPKTDTAQIFFNSGNTIGRTLRADVFTYLGPFKATAYPDLWISGAGRIDIDIWEK